MKHLKDAKKAIELGDSEEALKILEDLLYFSPKNTEALKLKAYLYDCRGRFEDSLQILHQMVKHSSSDDDENIQTFEKRMEEDRESLIYSQISAEGRSYFPFSSTQIFLLVLGLLGCVVFLTTSPSYLGHPNGFLFILISFIVFVILPWIFILLSGSRGIKKILISINGIYIYYARKIQSFRWDEMGTVVVEYDTNLKNDYLQLIILSKKTREKLVSFDLSKGHPVIKARRHFLRLIATYADQVLYVPKGK